MVLNWTCNAAWCMGGKSHSHGGVQEVPALKLSFEAYSSHLSPSQLAYVMGCVCGVEEEMGVVAGKEGGNGGGGGGGSEISTMRGRICGLGLRE